MNLSSNAWDLAILPVFLGFGPGNRRVLLQVEDCCNDCQSGMVGNMLDCLKWRYIEKKNAKQTNTSHIYLFIYVFIHGYLHIKYMYVFFTFFTWNLKTNHIMYSSLIPKAKNCYDAVWKFNTQWCWGYKHCCFFRVLLVAVVVLDLSHQLIQKSHQMSWGKARWCVVASAGQIWSKHFGTMTKSQLWRTGRWKLGHFVILIESGCSRRRNRAWKLMGSLGDRKTRQGDQPDREREREEDMAIFSGNVWPFGAGNEVKMILQWPYPTNGGVSMSVAMWI